MFCPECGNQVNDGSTSCPFCGVALNNAGVNQYGYQNNYNQPQDQYGYQNNFNQPQDQYGYQNNYNQPQDQYGYQNNFNQPQDQYGYQNNYNQPQDQYGYQDNYNQPQDQYGYQNDFNQPQDQYGYQNNYNQPQDQYGYQNNYNQQNQYGYQNTQVSAPKKKHTALKVIGILILVVAVAFGGFKGWKFLKGAEKVTPVEVASAASSETLEDLETLKSVLDTIYIDVDFDDSKSESDEDQESADTDEIIQTVNDYTTQVAGLKHLPANVKTAADLFMTTFQTQTVNYYKNMDFIHDFEDQVITPCLSVEPMNDYNSAAQNYESNMSAVSSAQAAYNKMKCPSMYKAVFDQFGTYLGLYDDALNRIAYGLSDDDIVYTSSGISLYLHVMNQMANSMNGFAEALNCYADTLEVQNKYLAGFKEELCKVIAMDYSEMASYEFESVKADNFYSSYNAIDTIYPSLYGSYGKFLSVGTVTLHGEMDIVIECQVEGLSETYKQTHHITPDFSYIPIKPVAASGSIDLTASRDTTMTVTISDLNGNQLDSQSFDVHIASENELGFYDSSFGYADYTNVLCYLTPSSESISSLKRNAIDVMTEMSDGSMTAFAGYQGPFISKIADVYFYASSVAIAVADAGVSVNDEKYSISNTSQNILFPEEVLNGKSGSEMEVALTIASALQSALLDTYLIINDNHIYVAVAVWDNESQYYVIDISRLTTDRSSYAEYASYIIQGQALDPSTTPCPVYYLPSEGLAQLISGENSRVVDCSDGAILGLAPFSH